jgi:hypothetical protein
MSAEFKIEGFMFAVYGTRRQYWLCRNGNIQYLYRDGTVDSPAHQADRTLDMEVLCDEPKSAWCRTREEAELRLMVAKLRGDAL